MEAAFLVHHICSHLLHWTKGGYNSQVYVQCLSWLSHLLIIKGAAGEAAEVLPRSQSCLCDGQVKSWSESQGPHHGHDQLQGEELAKRLGWHDLMVVRGKPCFHQPCANIEYWHWWTHCPVSTEDNPHQYHNKLVQVMPSNFVCSNNSTKKQVQ